jgi:hypothetical protein
MHGRNFPQIYKTKDGLSKMVGSEQTQNSSSLSKATPTKASSFGQIKKLTQT